MVKVLAKTHALCKHQMVHKGPQEAHLPSLHTRMAAEPATPCSSVQSQDNEVHMMMMMIVYSL